MLLHFYSILMQYLSSLSKRGTSSHSLSSMSPPSSLYPHPHHHHHVLVIPSLPPSIVTTLQACMSLSLSQGWTFFWVSFLCSHALHCCIVVVGGGRWMEMVIWWAALVLRICPCMSLILQQHFVFFFLMHQSTILERRKRQGQGQGHLAPLPVPNLASHSGAFVPFTLSFSALLPSNLLLSPLTSLHSPVSSLSLYTLYYSVWCLIYVYVPREGSSHPTFRPYYMQEEERGRLGNSVHTHTHHS